MRIMVVILVGFLFGCSTIQKSDTGYSKAILGSWMLMDRGYDDTYTLSLLAFTKEGRKCVVVTDYNLRGYGARATYWDNKWEIDDGVLISTVYNTSSSYRSPGDKIRDKITLFEENIFHVLMETNGDYKPRLEKHVRLIDEDPSRICNIVESQLSAYQDIQMGG